MTMDDPTYTQIFCALAGIAVVWQLVKWRFSPLYSIPTIGPSLPLLSYLGVYRYYKHAEEMLQEGYNKHKVFKVPILDQWVVVVSGAEMNEELRKFPDSHVSFIEATEEFISTKHTIAPDVHDHPIHLAVIRGPLTRNLNVVFADVIDEIRAGFKDVLPMEEGKWTEVPILPTMAKVVSRASNRVFVGLPLCREPEYLRTVVNFAFDVSKGRKVMSLTPWFLKDIVGHLIPWSKKAIRRTSSYLRPIIEERQRRLQEFGDDWNDKPNDFLMWLIEEARKVGYSVDLIVQGILVSNFAAIHTSSNSITQALYHLAGHPEYMQPLREEIEAVVKENGWTKPAIGKMRKLDSLMKESQRLNGITAIAVMRKALQDLTLSDGTYIPAGTLVAAASAATHHDERYYERPDEFEPFRFSEIRMEESESAKHQCVSTSAEFVAFGHGKHACPGRFFAVNELKAMMAYIILNYDVKYASGYSKPHNRSVWHSVLPSADTKVVFKKRQAATV